MKLSDSRDGSQVAFPFIRRKAIRVETGEVVRAEPLEGEHATPLVMRPLVSDVCLPNWAKANHESIRSLLNRHGAILFRDFNIATVRDFEEFTRAASGEIMEYNERSSPRTQVGERVYTSTDYPRNESIFLHNEHSYSVTYPSKLFFFCVRPAQKGGETALADTRRVLQQINPKIRKRFMNKGWMYVRNYGDGFGLPWQIAFQTKDRSAVEDYCYKNRIVFEWKDHDRFRTYQVRPVTAYHTGAGETVWFNHLTFFHISTLSSAMQEALTRDFEEEDLPNNTYYGDGSAVEPSVMDELREAYLQEKIRFTWHAGDVVLLDNMLVSHGREPFAGERKVLFAMADPVTRLDV